MRSHFIAEASRHRRHIRSQTADVHFRARARRAPGHSERQRPIPPLIEPVETRQLLSGGFGISGAASTDEGAGYVLNLAASGSGASSIDHWTVDWGDGNTQTVSGSPSSVTHVFADGVRDHTVTATVTNAQGTFAARNGAAVNDADLDTGFGAGGTGTASATGVSYTAAAGVAGGKFLVVGSQAGNFWLGRFNADGSPDTSFGPAGTGAVTADFSGRTDSATAVLVQPDGRIVVGGRSAVYTMAGSVATFALARFNADGTPDDGSTSDSTPGDSFGTAGKVRRATGDWTHDELNGLALQSDGKIIAAGSSESDDTGRFYRFAVARFTAAGAVDSTFAGGGSVQTDFPDAADSDRGYAVVVQSDDRIVVAGQTRGSTTGGGFGAVRYTAAGAVDTTFASSGFYASPGLVTGAAYAAVLQPDGKIVLGGRKYAGPAGTGDFALLRLTSAGAADTTFGPSGTGVVSTVVGSAAVSSVRALALDAAGRIVAAGKTYVTTIDFALARYSADGVLDSTFGNAGSAVTDVGNISNHIGNTNYDGTGGMALGPDGRVLLVGGDGYNAYMACYYGSPPAKTVRVNNVAPTLSLGGAASAAEGSVYTLELSRSDPGADTLSQWVINWGDGSPAQTVAGSAASVTHAYADDGTYTVSATATDEDGTYSAASRTVQVTNVAPTLTASGAASSNEGADYALTLSASDPGADTVSQWTINWGDGSAAQNLSGSQAQSPVTHRYADDGEYTITVSAADEDGAFAGPSRSVAVANVAPTLSIGGAASAAEGSAYSLTLSASDPGADTVSRWVIDWGDGSAQQTVTGNPPSVAHTFADGSAAHTVSASAVDEDGSYSAGTKSVTVTNVNPTVTLTGAAAVPQGQGYTLGFSAADPGADTVSQWLVNWGDGSQGTFSGAAASAQHTYAAMGSYTISATPTDEDGTYAATTRALSVTEPDRALGRPATASNYDPTPLADYRPTSAVDGNPLTRWSANGAGTQWIRVDLGATYNLSRVKLNWEGAYASAYKIQLSDDQISWRDAASVTGGNGGEDELTKADGLSGNGRYVQVLCTTAPYGNYSLFNFEVYGGLDLARNRPTTASGYDTSPAVDYRPLSATDGNSATRWSANNGGAQWIRVDLGAPYRLSGVKLKWEGAYASAYKIQVSNDASTWRDAYSVTGENGAVDDITNLAAGGRYVQVLCTSAPYGNYSLFDFEVYGGANLALKAAASASAYDTSPLVDYRASSAFDGNDNTRWSANGGGTQWLRADLGASFKLTRAKLNWEGAYGSAYKIQVSDDQVTWRDAATVTGGNGADDDVVLSNNANSTGRYVQVLMTTAPYGNYSLWSVEVFAG